MLYAEKTVTGTTGMKLSCMLEPLHKIFFCLSFEFLLTVCQRGDANFGHTLCQKITRQL